MRVRLPREPVTHLKHGRVSRTRNGLLHHARQNKEGEAGRLKSAEQRNAVGREISPPLEEKDRASWSETSSADEAPSAGGEKPISLSLAGAFSALPERKKRPRRFSPPPASPADGPDIGLSSPSIRE